MDKKMRESLLSLPLEQRVALARDIWDSLSDGDVPSPPALRKKLRQQLARYRANPQDVMTYGEFRQRSNQLLKSYGRKGRRSA